MHSVGGRRPGGRGRGRQHWPAELYSSKCPDGDTPCAAPMGRSSASFPGNLGVAAVIGAAMSATLATAEPDGPAAASAAPLPLANSTYVVFNSRYLPPPSIHRHHTHTALSPPH